MAVNFINLKEKHAVAGSSKLKATIAGHIYNIKVTADVDNGTIVKRGALVEGTYDVYTEAAASAEFRCKIVGKAANGNYYVEVTAVNGDLLLLNVPMIYEEYGSKFQHESNFYNAQHDIVRAYELYLGDIYEISAEGITGTKEVGQELKVTGKKLANAM